MINRVRQSTLPHLCRGLLAAIAALCLLLVTSMAALANTVHVYDNANVLNVSQVQSEAANLPYNIDIYTVNNFTGSNSAFDQETAQHTANNANLIVIAIDTVHHHLAIKAGSNVPLSNSQADDARNAFINNFQNSGYTGATIAAIHSLQSSLKSAPVSPGSNNPGSSSQPTRSGGGIFSSIFGTLCCIGLIILIIGGIIFAVSRRAFGFGRPRGIPYQQPFNQPYNQGYPPNYGPGYPGYNQGGGMNPWAAGGIGAAAGGLLGYELGKERGENEQREREQGGNWGGDGGNFGGGSSGDFGGGSSGDFGGGSSGDFGGGGGGGDFGGGDWGGGGGGDFGGGGGDSGGGSSGNF